MRKFLLFITIFILFFSAYSQNVKLEVQIIETQKSGYGDCGLCGNPDPAWKVTGYLNGVLQGTSTLTYENMSGNNWWL